MIDPASLPSRRVWIFRPDGFTVLVGTIATVIGNAGTDPWRDIPTNADPSEPPADPSLLPQPQLQSLEAAWLTEQAG